MCLYCPDVLHPIHASENIDHNPDYLNKASRYFPLIGWIVEGLYFSVFCFNFMMTSRSQ
jgi:adenosylcobinamide-GDP ribazoletransferase